ncbi:histone chaperone ASF1 [Puccinia sorghi]|uniref:Anti-silencing function protein 1 n=1 Tax=Puccinia sorghi TaxID=27349 RepID=A0A0L6VJR2_9BASI|nr:histone chaperone ASF1 [Puccinia sorghi]
MSIINITDIQVLENPAKFTDPYRFKITFECIAPLEDDIEWKLIYVGSPQTTDKDQELDTCMVGPVPAAAPDPRQIPTNDIVGVTVILLTASYKSKEFVRVGYYVNTEYDTPELRELYPDTELVTDEMLQKRPDPPIIAQLVRNVLAEKPRVTRFKIMWDLPSQPEPEQPVAKEGEPVSLFAPIPLEQEAPPVTSTSTNPSAAQKIVPQSMPANS